MLNDGLMSSMITRMDESHATSKSTRSFFFKQSRTCVCLFVHLEHCICFAYCNFPIPKPLSAKWNRPSKHRLMWTPRGHLMVNRCVMRSSWNSPVHGSIHFCRLHSTCYDWGSLHFCTRIISKERKAYLSFFSLLEILLALEKTLETALRTLSVSRKSKLTTPFDDDWLSNSGVF